MIFQIALCATGAVSCGTHGRERGVRWWWCVGGRGSETTPVTFLKHPTAPLPRSNVVPSPLAGFLRSGGVSIHHEAKLNPESSSDQLGSILDGIARSERNILDKCNIRVATKHLIFAQESGDANNNYTEVVTRNSINNCIYTDSFL